MKTEEQRIKMLEIEVKTLKRYIFEMLPTVSCHKCGTPAQTLTERESIEGTDTCHECSEADYEEESYD